MEIILVMQIHYQHSYAKPLSHFKTRLWSNLKKNPFRRYLTRELT